MSGIIITEMENIDEELSEQELERLNFKKLREAKLKENRKIIEEREKENAQKENKKKQTEVNVQTTPNGTVTTRVTSEDDGTKTTETEEVDSNVDEIDYEAGEGYDSEYQKDETKKGIDTSDVPDGKGENIPDKPDKPLENAEDASKQRNTGDGLKQGEHCSTDEQSESPEQDEAEEGGLDDGNSDKINCNDPDSTGLNDLQKEVVWVALDMLKWQPTSDTKKNGKEKRKWEQDIPINDAFYAKYQYPKDPTFGMHTDVTGTPLVRLKKFYSGMIGNNSSDIESAKIKYDNPWCAQTVSVIYAFAMASLKVRHKTKQDKGMRVCINKYKDKPSVIPFLSSVNSAEVCVKNAKTFGYNVSWKPTVGSIKFVPKSPGSGCGHVAIVIHVTKDEDIVVVEGNGAEDYSIKFWKKSYYYETSWKRLYKQKPSTYGICHPAHKKPKYDWKSILPKYPTTSVWHSPFINPSISPDLEWTEKVSRSGNPIDEVKSLINGFYNVEPRPNSNDDDFDTQT